MIGLRDKSWRRLGASLTGVALGFQLMLSSLGLVIAAASADPADPFAGHALCLAGESGATRPARPADSAPAHAHIGICCLWHQLSGIEPVAMAPAQPVAFAYILRDETGGAPLNPGPQRGPANARAPPTLA
jgi:hypothetical protein